MNSSRIWWWLVPDIEDALRRFPVTALLGLVGTGLMLALADTNLFGPVRNVYAPTPPSRAIFALSVAAVFASFIIENLGETRRWSRTMTSALALSTVALLVSLQFLHLVQPALSAQWLPFNFGWVADGLILLAIAVSAEGTSGATANIRILITFAAGLAAMLAAWVIVTAIAFLVGGMQGPVFGGNLAPTAQVFMYGLALFLWLSWMANLPTPEEGRTQHGALLAGTQFMRRIIVPLMIVVIISLATVTVRHFLQHDAQTVVRGVPMIVGPASAILFLVLLAWLYARNTGDESDSGSGTLVTGFAAVAPIVVVVLLAVCAYGYWQEWTAANAIDPALGLNLQPLGPHFIADTYKRWAIGGAIVTAALAALLIPPFRDLRLPFAVGGFALILMGFGPWSIDRIATRATAVEFDRVLTGAGLKPNGVLMPRLGAATISVQNHNALVQGLRRLLAVDGLGALAPVFEGAADNPFAQAGAGANPDQLANSILKRLDLEPTFGRAAVIARPVLQNRSLSIQVSRQSTKGVALDLAGYNKLSGPIGVSTVTSNRTTQPFRIDGKASEAQSSGRALALPETNAEFEAKVAAGGKLTFVKRSSGVELVFDLTPTLTKIAAYEEVRYQTAERNRLRRDNQPQQTVRDEPVPPQLTEPEIIEASGPIKGRLIIERLQGNSSDGNININDATCWLLYTASDLEKRP